MGKTFLITLLGVLLGIGVTVIAVTTWQDRKELEQEQTVQESCIIPSITMEDRIDAWKIEKDLEESYKIYLNLSEETLRRILSKLGTNVDVPAIAHEYSSNINYYITSLVRDKIHLNKDSIPGVDSLKIQLEALKVNNIEKIPIIVSNEDE